MRGVMVAIISGLLSAGCSVFGIRDAPTPHYTVERTIGAIEVRHYGPRLAAQVLVSGSEVDARSKGFEALAKYIFGDNSRNAKVEMTAPVSQSQTIAMTAPVAQAQAANGEWRIRFFMPEKYTLETLPRPNDSAIQIVTVPAQTVAVLRYSGSIGVDAVREARRRLMKAVTDAGLHPEGEPFSWFYDPPWTLPPLRRNEEAVVLQPG